MPPRGFGRGLLRGARRIIRPGRIIRPFVRRYPGRLIRRMLFGGFIYLAVANRRPYKLYPEEVERVENHAGKPAEDLTEDELKSSMKDLNIENREVSDSEYNKINEMNGKSNSDAKSAVYCSFCGAKLAGQAKFCSSCGSRQ